jgi:predicted nucleic acid-binding protein
LIFLDTNVVSEPLRISPDPNILAWLSRHDSHLALSSVVIAEVAFGIARIPPDRRSLRLEEGLLRWRSRFARRIYPLTEEAALQYGELMGEALRRGRPMAIADDMMAAIALVNGGTLATRNLKHFEGIGLDLVSPWES